MIKDSITLTQLSCFAYRHWITLKDYSDLIMAHLCEKALI